MKPYIRCSVDITVITLWATISNVASSF